MIESIQYNAALAITGCIRGTSREKIYNELWVMSLYGRRNYRRNDMLPNFLKLLIPHEVVLTNYNLRRRHRNNIPTRTNKFPYSFPHCMNAWGKLSKFITCSLSFSVFLSPYLQFFRVSPNFIYKVHNPVGLKYLTRLRMGLSHLKSHKFLHNFNDTLYQYCVCDNKSMESTQHYLLFCPIFCHTRDQLFIDLQNEISIIPFHKTFLTQLHLYGCESYNVPTNTFINTFMWE